MGQDLQAHDQKWLKGLPRKWGTRSLENITETNSSRSALLAGRSLKYMVSLLYPQHCILEGGIQECHGEAVIPKHPPE